MGELINTDKGGIIGLIHNQGGTISIPQPFERDIFLFDSSVAGTSYITGIEELEPFLHVGDRLQFFREPDNPHDKQATRLRQVCD